MKKIFSTGLILLVLLSMVSMAFAANQPVTKQFDLPDSPKLGDDLNPVPSPADSTKSMDRERIRDKANELKEQFLQKREKLQKMNQNLSEAKNKFNEEKANMLQIRNELKNASNEEKAEIRNRLRNKANSVLENQADAIMKKMNALRERELISQEKYDELNAQLESIKTAVADGTASQEEVVQFAKDIRGVLNEVKVQSRERAANFVENKVNAILNKAEVFNERMTARIDRLTERGFDTTELQTALDTYNAKVEEAKLLLDDAKALWDLAVSAETQEEKLDYLAQAHEVVKEVNATLIDAFHELRDVINEYRSAQNQVEDSVDDSIDEPVEGLNDTPEQEVTE